MGQVYKAVDRKLGKPVALKPIRPDLAARAGGPSGSGGSRRWPRGHAPDVRRVHDLGEIDGILYISMENIEGQTLDRGRVGRALSPRQVIPRASDLRGPRGRARALDRRRDLEAGNIMVGLFGHALVMDFGWRTSTATSA